MHPCINLAVVRAGNGVSSGSWVSVIYSVDPRWNLSPTVQISPVNLLQPFVKQLLFRLLSRLRKTRLLAWLKERTIFTTEVAQVVLLNHGCLGIRDDGITPVVVGIG